MSILILTLRSIDSTTLELNAHIGIESLDRDNGGVTILSPYLKAEIESGIKVLQMLFSEYSLCRYIHLTCSDFIR